MESVKIKSKPVALLIISFLLNFLVACGSDNDNDSPALPTPQEQEQVDQGTFQAVLNPLNISTSGTPDGLATFRLRGDELEADIDVTNAPSSTIHRQYVYTQGACPTPANDLNLDGFIDFPEAMGATGPILIPLDNELRSQSAGGNFPIASRSGRYSYDESTSLTRMLADLHSSDPLPTDDVVKLDPSANLNLEGRIVMVHGVRSSTELPSTVASRGDSPAQRTLPIACGVLIRVADTGENPEPRPTPVPQWPWDNSFSTRLNPDLLIAGVRCNGGERTEATVNGRTIPWICRRGQWLVTVDNINHCDNNGCTEVAVMPIVANLRRANIQTPSTQAFYNIRPASPTSEVQRDILRMHWVRFDLNSEPVVFEKSAPGAL